MMIRHVWHYIEGFWMPDRPQSLARLLAAPVILAGCWVALHHPEDWETATGMVTGGTALYAARTVGSNGHTRPFWAKLPDQALVDRAKKIIQTVAERAPNPPNPPNPPNQPNQPNHVD